jgi:peptide/nickel transport system substrate-binding protein
MAQPMREAPRRRDFLAQVATIASAIGLAPFQAARAQQATSGGLLRSTLYAEPSTLDPHRTITTIEFTLRGAFFNGLVEETPELILKPALAESWEASADATTYTFRLRRGVKFHDGSEVTAESVQASLKRASDPAASPSAAIKGIADRIATLSAPDRYTVKIELKAPNGTFLPDMSEIMIVPSGFDPAKPVGTGPFQLVEWVRNQRVRMTKFADYFKKDLPYLDEVVYVTTPDEDQRLNLLRTRQVEFLDFVSLARVQNLEKEGKFRVIKVMPGQRTAAYIMRINCSKSPLDKVKVRQALSYAIDREAILDANFGYGGIRSNFMPSKHWAFNPNARSYDRRDVAKAKQLLGEAGLGSGFPLELTHHTVTETYKSIAQIVQANLADVGVKVTLVPLEIGVWVDKVLRRRDFQLALSGNSVRSDPDAVYSDMYDQTRVNGGSIQWQNEEAQRLIGEGRTLVDQEQRRKVYARFQEIIQEESPILVLNEIPAMHGASPSVQGFRSDNRSLTLFETVWLKK